MIEVQVPKDISGFEETLVGPFTARQTVCVVAAAALEFVYYSVMKSLDLGLSADTLVFIGVLLAIPILMLAVWKPYGMRAETYILYFVLPLVLGKKDRPYEIHNVFDILLEEDEEEAEAKLQNQKKKNKKSKGKADVMYA